MGGAPSRAAATRGSRWLLTRLPGFASHEPGRQRAPGEGGGEAEGGEGALADDARCHAESGEDRRLEQDGTAYEALPLTASSLAAASEGPVRWRRQGEAEPTGV